MTRAVKLLAALSAAAILSAACGSVVCGDEAADPAVKAVPKPTPKRPATPADLEKWAKDLDSDEFLAREDATQNLVAAGAPAIKYVQPIVSIPSLEASTRAMHVLRDIGLSSDLDTQEAVRTALEEIAKEPTPVGKRASRTTAWLNEQRSSQTIRNLEELGAKVQRTEYSDGLQEIVIVESVHIGESWKGTEKDLRRLKWLVDVRQLVLIGDKMGDVALAQAALMPGLKSLHLHRTAVTDKGMQVLVGCGALQEFGAYYSSLGDGGVAVLGRLTTLSSIKLYGTKVTPEAKERLDVALNKLAKMDYRRGGFLGISCAPDFDGLCRISTVHPDSPANKGGLQTRDVLVRFAGKELKDFEGLTAIISGHQAGETVEVEVLRDVLDPDEKQKTLKLKVTLAEWDVDLSVNGGRLPRP